MSLQNISNAELIVRMEKLVRSERKITHLVLIHILEIEERKLYADLGFDGMYSYLTQNLGYSESAAYRRLQSARLLKKMPSLVEKIEDGSLNLSQLTQVQKCVKEQFQKTGKELSSAETFQILAKIENKNTFETEKTLAIEFDRPIQVHESLKLQKDESVRIDLTLSKEKFAELEQARSLLSHVCPDGNWAEVISYLAQNFNRKKIQARSTQIAKPVIANNDSNLPTHSFAAKQPTPHSEGKNPALTFINFPAGKLKRQRKYISVHTKRDLFKKADHCCEYRNPETGIR